MKTAIINEHSMIYFVVKNLLIDFSLSKSLVSIMNNLKIKNLFIACLVAELLQNFCFLDDSKVAYYQALKHPFYF